MLEKLKEHITEWLMPTVILDPDSDEIIFDPSLSPEEIQQLHLNPLRTKQRQTEDVQ